MRILPLIAIYLFCFSAYSQQQDQNAVTVSVKRTIQYQTTADWTKTSSTYDKKQGIEVVNYQRSPIKTDSTNTFIVTQSCKVENARGASIKAYSLASLSMFQKADGFKITKTFTHTDGLLQIPYTVGYWAVYTDKNKTQHKVVIIHGIHSNGNGFQFFIDCPAPVFEQSEVEITAQVSSLKLL
ncbi:hypothetical protein [Cytophaga hutchinsonii]|uniref:Uncharacterized protein n=1 Tax=Cytophaga hutchinsonii (strain ATCC 33406 / DSM 1761 / CIP 103989 / NBRC 15051 / NCIMB 9469 / D465) TaxID=269798 RepID=A0A6N4SXA2_CYTH3|nr:hypothetical protein [Cytophaga hutchinsonii]ABG60947.1 hypothetical protein CHU_3714 [Cytophaga hutchinsonii ATCC 33406]SFX42992.1 hypothetical protein SAMN04487930_10461 [Cytophaga hutchinsonii ATCC 33406]